MGNTTRFVHIIDYFLKEEQWLLTSTATLQLVSCLWFTSLLCVITYVLFTIVIVVQSQSMQWMWWMSPGNSLWVPVYWLASFHFWVCIVLELLFVCVSLCSGSAGGPLFGRLVHRCTLRRPIIWSPRSPVPGQHRWLIWGQVNFYPQPVLYGWKVLFCYGCLSTCPPFILPLLLGFFCCFITKGALGSVASSCLFG
jgi:hypothetical protein